MASRVCVGAVGAVGLLAAGAAAGQGIPEAYTLVELVPAAGQPVSVANAVNDLNEVGGWSGTGGFDGLRLATVWDTSAVPASLGIPAGGSGSVVDDINNEGTALINVIDGSEDKVVRLADGTVLTLQASPPNVLRPGTSINNAGQVAGTTLDTVVGFCYVVWSQTPTGMVPTISCDDITESVAIADSGVVSAGESDGSGLVDPHVDVYDLRDGSIVRISIPAANDFLEVRDASAGGYVVGAFDDSGLSILPLVVLPDGTLLQPRAIGCPNGLDGPACRSLAFKCAYRLNVVANAVNEAGVVVCTSDVVQVDMNDTKCIEIVGRTASIWSQATDSIELSTLVVDGSADGWQLDEATDINEAGVVVGNGINPLGQERGFILIPRPRCAADVNADGGVDSADFFAWVNAFGNGCD